MSTKRRTLVKAEGKDKEYQKKTVIIPYVGSVNGRTSMPFQNNVERRQKLEMNMKKTVFKQFVGRLDESIVLSTFPSSMCS